MSDNKWICPHAGVDDDCTHCGCDVEHKYNPLSCEKKACPFDAKDECGDPLGDFSCVYIPTPIPTPTDPLIGELVKIINRATILLDESRSIYHENSVFGLTYDPAKELWSREKNAIIKKVEG